MNDWKLGARKLEELLKLARAAETDFERAAVFAATQSLVAMYEDDRDERLGEEQLQSYAMEKVHKACWGINAILGYDIDNGHDQDSHYSAALGNLNSLNSVLNDSDQSRANHEQ